jgi:hypothetical protein
MVRSSRKFVRVTAIWCPNSRRPETRSVHNPRPACLRGGKSTTTRSEPLATRAKGSGLLDAIGSGVVLADRRHAHHLKKDSWVSISMRASCRSLARSRIYRRSWFSPPLASCWSERVRKSLRRTSGSTVLRSSAVGGRRVRRRCCERTHPYFCHPVE